MQRDEKTLKGIQTTQIIPKSIKAILSFLLVPTGTLEFRLFYSVVHSLDTDAAKPIQVKKKREHDLFDDQFKLVLPDRS